MRNNKIKESKELAAHYMTTLIDVARESFLILDSDMRVVSANPTFYSVFRILQKETENKLLYELGNGQWNILELRELLEKILPNQKTVKNYEVKHFFEKIGEKIMLLNARQIDSVELIVLAIEDITDNKILENKLANYTRDFKIKIAERTKELAGRIKELELLNKSMVGRELKMIELKEEIVKLKKVFRNGNSKNSNGKKGNSSHKKNGR